MFVALFLAADFRKKACIRDLKIPTYVVSENAILWMQPLYNEYLGDVTVKKWRKPRFNVLILEVRVGGVRLSGHISCNIMEGT